MTDKTSLDDILPFPLSKEEAEKELKRIFGSFTPEFKTATIQMLRAKVLVRLKLIQKDFPNKTAIEQMEMSWAEVALETMMIMTDAITRTAIALQESDDKLKALSHLMPTVPSTKQ